MDPTLTRSSRHLRFPYRGAPGSASLARYSRLFLGRRCSTAASSMTSITFSWIFRSSENPRCRARRMLSTAFSSTVCTCPRSKLSTLSRFASFSTTEPLFFIFEMSKGSFYEDGLFVYGNEDLFEMKCYNNHSLTLLGDNTINICDDIAIGLGDDDRVGDEIFIHRVDIRGYQKFQSGSDWIVTSGKVANMIIVDTQARDGAWAAPSQPFTVPTIVNGLRTASIPFGKLALDGRYRCVIRDEGDLRNQTDNIGLGTFVPGAVTISSTAANVNPMNFNPFLTGVTAIPPPAPVVTTNTPALQSVQCFPDTVTMAAWDIELNFSNKGCARDVNITCMFDPPLHVRFDDAGYPVGPVPYAIVSGDCGNSGGAGGLFYSYLNVNTFFTDEPIPSSKVLRRLSGLVPAYNMNKRVIQLLDGGSSAKIRKTFDENEPVSLGGRKRGFEVDSRKRYRESSKK